MNVEKLTFFFVGHTPYTTMQKNRTMQQNSQLKIDFKYYLIYTEIERERQTERIKTKNTTQKEKHTIIELFYKLLN